MVVVVVFVVVTKGIFITYIQGGMGTQVDIYMHTQVHR